MVTRVCKAPGALFLLIFVVVAVSGCGASPEDPVAQAEARQLRIARRDRMLGLHQCQSNLEVFTPGMGPARPFRVLGPVEGNWGFTVEARFESMRKKACEMGAQAIVDAQERFVEVAGTRTATTRLDTRGRPVTVVEEPHSTVRRTSALAVVYVDAPAP